MSALTHKVRILVVDDDAAMRELLVTGLGSSAREVEAADGGDDALARLSATPFDLVATELRMAGMSGLELCRRIAEGNPERSRPRAASPSPTSPRCRR